MKIIDKDNFSRLLQVLSGKGYVLIGPTLKDNAVVFSEINGIDELPAGWTDEQEAGKYRLKRRKDNALFGYVSSPQSWKRYLFPPRITLWEAEKKKKGFKIRPLNLTGIKSGNNPSKYAFVGVRPCDLNAILIQDRVFTGGKYVDSYYNNVRKNSFIVAVNCTQAGKTCFCVSMKTGPKVKNGFDISLTEIVSEKEHYFVLETGSTKGKEIIKELDLNDAGDSEIARAEKAIMNTEARMGREMDTKGIKELFYNNMESHQWNEVAARCLTCANCTMVCPTCFCSAIEDVTDLQGKYASRLRRWDSCFTLDYSKVAGGNFRTSIRARYRQWITHKLASWIDQFGISGCVGCGRCITWCPVGIDITEEVKKLRSN